MGFAIRDLGIASSVYLGLFVIYNVFSHYIMSKIRKYDRIFTPLWFYGLLRVGGQISGLGFAIEGYSKYQWLIAYIVLTVEGYFVLVLTSIYMLIDEQTKGLGHSPLTVTLNDISTLGIMKSRFFRISPKGLVHQLLIMSNALLVVGSVILSGMTVEELENSPSKVTTSKILRTVGQAIFLIMTALASGYAVYNYQVKKLRTPTMYALLAAFPFLWVRGIYGILSIHIPVMDYLVISNYFSASAHKLLTIYEYVLSTTMEFVAVVFLVGTYKYRNKHQSFVDVQHQPLVNLENESNDFEKAQV